MAAKTKAAETSAAKSDAAKSVAAEPSAEEQLRSRALDLLRTTILESILESNEPLRTVDAAKNAAEVLNLELSEEELGGLASLARMVLDSDPLFSQSNRQWDLALRMGRAEGDRRKPVERAFEDFIDLVGRPAESLPVAVFASAVYGRTSDYYEKMLDKMVDNEERFFSVDGGKVGICRWLLEITSDDPADVEWDNFEDASVLEKLRSLKTSGTDALSVARSIVEGANAPVDNKALQFLAWSADPTIDPKALFTQLYTDPALSLERGPTWVTAGEHEKILAELKSLAIDPSAAADQLATAAPVDEAVVETGISLAATTARVSNDDLDQVYNYMQSEDRTFKLPELLQQVLEAFPGSRTYSGVRDSLLSRMREDHRFQWLGYERFRLAGHLPMEVEVLPEGLGYDDSEYLGADEEEVDKTVDPRDWKFNLDEQIRHYMVQDVGDDCTSPAVAPKTLESSPPLHHYVAGTRYLRNTDRGFFPAQPEVVQATLVPEDGAKFDVWVNNRLGLVYGLKEWYDANLPWVGGKFTIAPGEQPDEYKLTLAAEPEALMDVQLPRLQELLQLRGEAATNRLPLTEIVTRILKGHDEGVHFVTLFAEVNVVRRTRRAVLASILSSQRFFAQSPTSPGIWSFDEKRAAKAKKKTGPKRVREMYDEDDEELD